MSKKDSELIAGAISKVRQSFCRCMVPTENPTLALDLLVREFQTKLKETNPRFNAGRFWEACQ